MRLATYRRLPPWGSAVCETWCLEAAVCEGSSKSLGGIARVNKNVVRLGCTSSCLLLGGAACDEWAHDVATFWRAVFALALLGLGFC